MFAELRSLLHCRGLLALACALCALATARLGAVETDGSTAEHAALAGQAQALLRQRCQSCHGSEKHEGGLQLHRRDAIVRGGDSGAVIAAGMPDKSLLLIRVQAEDDDQRMPPAEAGARLTADEIALLNRWIKSGAPWPEDATAAVEPTHWSYRPVQRPAPPVTQDARWPANGIDSFVLERLERAKFAASPAADRATLVKRLSYDLLGLPADPSDVDQFLADASPEAYARLVDRLLQSPHFGERWGRHWLDKARYADSDGYEKDNPRPDAWRYRDWVIEAVNQDLPLDQFTHWQLAGDLLADATPTTRLATAFNRQTLTNTEGGADQEQFRFEAMFDRVNTLGAVWLGLTVGCAQCHSHKYDQLSQAEYYQLIAFFNNGDEANTEVTISPEAVRRHAIALADHQRKLAELQAQYAAHRETLCPMLPAWEQALRVRLDQAAADPLQAWTLEAQTISTNEGVRYERLADGSYLAHGTAPSADVITLVIPRPAGAIRALRIEALPDDSLPEEGPGRSNSGDFVLNELRVWASTNLEFGDDQRVTIASARADFSAKEFPVQGALDGEAKTGWSAQPQTGRPHWAVFEFAEPLPSGAAQLKVELTHSQGKSHILGRFRLAALAGTDPDVVAPATIRTLLALPAAERTSERTAEQNQTLLDHFAPHDARAAELLAAIAKHQDATPDKPVMAVRVLRQRTKKPRTTHVLRRGDFLQPSDEVAPGVPATLPPLVPRANGLGGDRLDLALWLVDGRNPLTPRVMVNQIWQQLFGQGLVETAGDFGVRGTPPSHPELLDWLAAELVARQWSRKELIRLIVHSATYRQTSAQGADVVESDPQNRLWRRQNRWRVEAEAVRDITLAAAGLLDGHIGGPSVFPYMPEDVAKLSYANNFNWKTSAGGDRYRRGLYTFFKRTAPHPSLTAFDCPDANTTCVMRQTSNTPVQALTLLNEASCHEAAQGLAALVQQGPMMPGTMMPGATAPGAAASDSAMLALAMRRCVARAPAPDEMAQLAALLAEARSWYTVHPDQASALCAPVELDPPSAVERAAWIAVCRVLLNLDELLTRE